jgi:AcrR family transcriptional regulator
LRKEVNMGRPRSHGPDTAIALLDAAENIAQTAGPTAVAVRQVADDVGTTTRAVYTLFGSKDGLLVGLATRGLDILTTEIAALPVTEDPLEDVVRAGAVSFRRFVLDHPALFRIAFQHEAVTADLVARYDAARRTALAQLTARFERVMATGRLRATTPTQAACYFHAMCEGLAALELRNALGHDPEKLWSGGLRAVVLGLP